MQLQNWAKWCFRNKMRYFVYFCWSLTIFIWVGISVVSGVIDSVREGFYDWWDQGEFLKQAERQLKKEISNE